VTTLGESIAQPGLRPGRYLTLQERYDEWLRTRHGRLVYEAVADRALALQRRGFRHYGIAAIFEAARYAHAIEYGVTADGFLLNNSYRSRLARDLMADYPQLRGFFETRELTA
jgi:hypothetical protein